MKNQDIDNSKSSNFLKTDSKDTEVDETSKNSKVVTKNDQSIQRGYK